jgi:hypothetical protein
VILLGVAGVFTFAALVADARGYRYIAAVLGAVAVLLFTAMLTVLLTAPGTLDTPAPAPTPLPSHGPACVDLAWLDGTWKCIPADQAG